MTQTGLTPKPKSVREAGPADERGLFELLVDMHRYNDAGWGYPYDPALVRGQIEVGTRGNLKTRTDKNDKRIGIIGVIDGPDGKLAATIGLFGERPMWFSQAMGLVELWVYVRPGASRRCEVELRQFARWAFDSMKADIHKTPPYPYPFELLTGFQHRGEHFKAMFRIWRRWGGRLIGMLFVIR
jgi:hypothetical protein